MGISYDHFPEMAQLKGTINDVNRVHSLLHHVWGFGNIRQLKGSLATRDAIMTQISELAECTGVIVLYVSGHGARLGEDKIDEGILPADVAFRRSSSQRDWEAGSSEAITGRDLEPFLMKMVSKAAVTFLFDTCHSGCLYREGAVPSGNIRFKTPVLKEGRFIFKYGQLGGGWAPDSASQLFVHLAAASHLHGALELDEVESQGSSAGAFTLTLERVLVKLLRGRLASFLLIVVCYSN